MLMLPFAVFVLAGAPSAEETPCGPLPPPPEPLPTLKAFQCPAGYTRTEEGPKWVSCYDERHHSGDSLMSDGDTVTLVRGDVQVTWFKGRVSYQRTTQNGKTVGVEFRKDNDGNLEFVRRFASDGTLSCAAVRKAGVLARQPDELDSQEIRATIAGANPHMKRCYEGELQKTPELAGKVVLAWTIQDGKVTAIQLKEDTLKSEAVTMCMKGVLESLTFKAASKPLAVSYPWVFSFKK
jgi:hypothetical protein